MYCSIELEQKRSKSLAVTLQFVWIISAAIEMRDRPLIPYPSQVSRSDSGVFQRCHWGALRIVRGYEAIQCGFLS